MKKKLLVKVCGNTEKNNLNRVLSLSPDLIGFIFYPKSDRYVDNPKEVEQIDGSETGRVGVFVNATEEDITKKIQEYKLDYVQLHGDESPNFCSKINAIIPVFKAFQINNKFNFDSLKAYMSVCYNFLFDTASTQYGGSGKKFNWELLSNYKLDKPFFLSGGIAEEDAAEINKINHPNLIGVDLNSKFETRAGIKDVTKLKNFLKHIKL